MSRLSERIFQCERLAGELNKPLRAEVNGLLDAQSGKRFMRNRVPAEDMRHYERGHHDGLTLKAIDEMEAKNHGHHQSESSVSVLPSEARTC